MDSLQYEQALAARDGLRLHLNENTGGCSPAVVERLRRVGADEMAYYPAYTDAVHACARYFGVRDEQVVLTNGLDEGILVTSLACLRQDAGRPEAIIIEPAFDMYPLCADAAGARIVSILPRPDFAFPLEEALAAINDATRLVYLTSPNNPTGQRIPRDAIRAVARCAPDRAVALLDEAYADFAGDSFLDELDRHPNIVVGRTFAKSHGLAGLRVGALVGAPATLAPIRRIVPPFSVNVCASAALPAALADVEYVRRYAAETEQSKRLLYDACDRLGLAYWPSAANFVLLRAGDRLRALVDGLAARHIYVRDKSDAPGCAGCLRITAGRVEHTKACIAAMEDILCGGR